MLLDDNPTEPFREMNGVKFRGGERKASPELTEADKFLNRIPGECPIFGWWLDHVVFHYQDRVLEPNRIDNSPTLRVE